ncbi:MAG: peptidoglycan DD-metalloendopeptidase family protein [Lachnospiraceae bacterium]|nr:peptidoglycan DD-metalloendopeptidase family protein [Ruminococcus sp.]MCM1274107.1 peptidoglycan DD-metalloendopeptidase family protein [Lachnospiraceae bacterium]
MNNKQLFDSLNNADDKFILEAVEDFTETYVEKKRGFADVMKFALPCAACAAMIFAGAVVVKGRLNDVAFGPAEAPEVYESTDECSDNTPAADESSMETDESTDNAFAVDEKPEFPDIESPGIVTCEPLALPEKDPATFWEGELPVCPVKNPTNDVLEAKGEQFTNGLDLSMGWMNILLDAKRGDAVYAVADGEVTFAGIIPYQDTHDYSVIIKHSDDLYTSYEILDVDCGVPVQAGDKVTAGQVIGYVGIARYKIHTDDNWMVYGVHHADPITSYYEVQGTTDNLEKWLNSGLVKPLDNVGDDFEFDNIDGVVSRNEKITPAPYGAKVYAVSAGTVTYAGDDYFPCGMMIKILHDNNIESTYYHLDGELPHLKTGDVVEAGEPIGYVSDNTLSGVSGLGYFISEIDDFYLESGGRRF